MRAAKLLALAALAALSVCAAAWAQSAAFDIATFMVPPGWSRQDGNGNVLLQTTRRVSGREIGCQIYLFGSHASTGSPGQNFAADWQAKVAGALGVATRPAPQAGRSTEGFDTVSGRVDALVRGVPMRVLLVSATGFGKTMSFMALTSPNMCDGELTAFFQNLNLATTTGGGNGPPGATPSDSLTETPGVTGSAAAGGTAGVSRYRFTPPDGWSRQGSDGQLSLVSPLLMGTERCQIDMLPLRAASGHPLGDDAIATFRQLFRADPLETYPTPLPRLAAGVAPAGWEYFQIRKLVGGQEGDGRGIGRILLMAKVGSQVATIVGTSKDFMVSNCFGELVRDVWPQFFYGLDFDGTQGKPESEASLRQKLAGQWLMATGSVGLGYWFAANGHYASTASHRVVTAVTSTELLATTSTFFGDGAYSMRGNRITLKPDGQAGRTYYFRVGKASRDAGKTWTDELCLLEPGASGEVCYRRGL